MENGLSVNFNADSILGPGDPPVKKPSVVKKTLAPAIDVAKILPSSDEPPNFTPTKDPNVVIGKLGARITMDGFKHANANGYAWNDFPAYADWMGSWARPITTPMPISPYYRAYGGTPNISGGDIAILAAKNNPQINTILQRNIAKDGDVPMYGPEDADAIRALIQHERNAALASHLK